MTTTDRTEHWVLFFKALADPSRLQIVGLLAHRPHSVEEIAANLHLSPPTISHHLQRLLSADLVEARALQYYNVYSLRPDTLKAMADVLLSSSALKEAAKTLDRHAYAQKVEARYLSRGHLKKLPSQKLQRQIVLDYLARQFQTGKQYTERRVNNILKAFHPDYTSLRMELVASGRLETEQGWYRRIEN